MGFPTAAQQLFDDVEVALRKGGAVAFIGLSGGNGEVTALFAAVGGGNLLPSKNALDFGNSHQRKSLYHLQVGTNKRTPGMGVGLGWLKYDFRKVNL